MPPLRTVTTPVIPEAPWISQWYVKLPTVVNVRLNVPAACNGDPGSLLSKMTLCWSVPCHCQVTWDPTSATTLLGA